MKIIKFIYQDQEIDFEINKNIMVNATEMAKISDKKVENFTRLDQTHYFIKSCLNYAKSEENKTPKSVLYGIENENDLIISRQKSGTWMHRILALKFAAWLNSDFEVWVYVTIDTLINQYYNQHKEATIKQLTAKQKKQVVKQTILEKYSNLPEITEYFELDKTDIEAGKERHLAMINQFKQLKLEFDFNK